MCWSETKKPSKKIAQKMAVVKDGMKDTMKQNEEILAEVRAQDANVAGSMNYLATFFAVIRCGKHTLGEIFSHR